ncbi:MAG: acetyl-CoA carboxylase carboxyl transferase subunit alpha, partial [Alphaproteobacteria bacterium]
RDEVIAAVGKALKEELKALSRKKAAALRAQRREKFLNMGTKGLAA